MLVVALIVLSGVLVSVTLPYCQQQAKAADGERKIGVALLVLACVLASIWGWYYFNYGSAAKMQERKVAEAEIAAQKKAERDRSACEVSFNTFLAAKQFVEENLKSPSTAKFGERPLRTKYLGDCTHEIWGYVDAQNAFGATIRTEYYVKAKNERGTSNWRLIDIKM